MLKEETLSKTERHSRTYQEPEGEFLELISSSRHSITVLTRVKSDKVAEVDPPIDPGKYNVAELKDELEIRSFSDEQLNALVDQEANNKGRKTAVRAIKEQL